MKVKLEMIIEAIEMADDVSEGFLNMDTMEILWLNDYFDSEENEENEKISSEIDNHFDRYLRLPTQWDIHEYSIMEDFIDSLEDTHIQNKLYRAINGRGAFRRFKDTVYYLDIEKEWFQYRDKAIADIARRWCKENKIDCEE